MWYCDIVILNKKIKTKLVKKFNICDVLDKGGNQTCQFSCGRIFKKFGGILHIDVGLLLSDEDCLFISVK